MFELFNRNGDRCVEETGNSLGKLGITMPCDELSTMIVLARIIADNHGCVDVEEFCEPRTSAATHAEPSTAFISVLARAAD